LKAIRCAFFVFFMQKAVNQSITPGKLFFLLKFSSSEVEASSCFDETPSQRHQFSSPSRCFQYLQKERQNSIPAALIPIPNVRYIPPKM